MSSLKQLSIKEIGQEKDKIYLGFKSVQVPGPTGPTGPAGANGQAVLSVENVTNSTTLAPSGVSLINSFNGGYNVTLGISTTGAIKNVILDYDTGSQVTVNTPRGSFFIAPGLPIRNMVYTGEPYWTSLDPGYTSLFPTTSQLNNLIGSDSIVYLGQGNSVALSGDGQTLAVGTSVESNNASINYAIIIYVLINGSWQQQATVYGNDNIGYRYQYSVALSADGNTLAVGNYPDNNGIGATWIFTRSNGVWTQQGDKLVGTGYAGNPQQGTSVALSSDGNTLAVGGPNDNGNIGATWIFTRSGGVWTQYVSKLVGTGTGTGTDESLQGQSVSLSSDGTTLAVGAPQLVSRNPIGNVFIFILDNSGSWNQQANLSPNDAVIPSGKGGKVQFGYSVSLSSDGNTLASGGISDNHVGATWVFTRSGTNWTQQGSKLVANDYIGLAEQGYSVSLSSDGNTLAVGGSSDNNGIGATWIYIRSGGVWTQYGSKLVGSGSVGTPEQGNSVSLSADASTLAIGGPYDNADPTGSYGIGATWIFNYTASTGWTQLGNKLVAVDLFNAYSLDVSADGNTLVVGVPSDNNLEGAVWTFIRSGETWAEQTKLIDPGNTGPNQLGQTVSLSADGNTLATGGNNYLWVFIQSNATWTLQATQISFPANINSLSLSADGNTLAVGMPDYSGNSGITYIFTRANGVWTSTSQINVTGNTGNAEAGYSVALSDEANFLAIGGPTDNGNIGATWIFTQNYSGNWSQLGNKIVGYNYSGTAQQGYSVSLSSDGNTLTTGGPYDNNNIGASWLFRYLGTDWVQQGDKITGNDTTGSSAFGQSVAVSADGNTLVVSGPKDNYNQGASWIYTNLAGNWIQQGSKLSAPSVSENRSTSGNITVSKNGDTMALISNITNTGQIGVQIYT